MQAKWWVGTVMAGLLVQGTSSASAQSYFGTHSWQMQPYCNVVTLTLSPSPSGARLEGADNLCGAVNPGSAVGMAIMNGAGQVTLSFTVVTAPTARPVHVSAIVNLQNGQGVWTDSGGSSGTMAYGANLPGLPVRPIPITQLGPNVITTLEIAPGAVKGSDIDSAEVQARVSGVCPGGQAMSSINANGTVACTPVTGGGGGTGVAFKAGGHAQGVYLPQNIFTDVAWASTVFNVGGGVVNGNRSTYAAPSAGLYLLTATVAVNGNQTAGTYCGGFRVNGAEVGLACHQYVPSASIDTDHISLSTTVQLNAGDAVAVSVLPIPGANTLRINGSNPAEANFTVTRLQ